MRPVEKVCECKPGGERGVNRPVFNQGQPPRFSRYTAPFLELRHDMEGPSLETYTGSPNSLNGAQPHDDVAATAGSNSGRTALVVAGFVLAGAAITFTLVRALTRKRPADPTTERIQQLIDEANRLLKQLDEKQPGR